MGPAVDARLRGIEKQPFPSFDEGFSYLERVTVADEAEARRLLAEEYRVDPENLDRLQPIYMRWVEEIDRDTQPELDNCEAPCWIECSEHDADALPFWKETP